MNTKNPYEAPETSTTLTSDSQVEHLDDKKLKRLYSQSRNVSAITALLVLGLFAVCLIVLPSTKQGLEFVFVSLAILLYIIALIGLFKRTLWGRVMGIMVCIIYLINMPHVRLFAIVGLFVFFVASDLFGVGKILHKDLKIELKRRKMRAKKCEWPN